MRNFWSLWITVLGMGPTGNYCPLYSVHFWTAESSDSRAIEAADANEFQPIRCTCWDLEGRSQVKVIFPLLVFFLPTSEIVKTRFLCDRFQHPSSCFVGFERLLRWPQWWFLDSLLVAIVVFLNSNSEVTSGFFTFLTEEGVVVPLVGQFCSVLETFLNARSRASISSLSNYFVSF